MNLGQLMFRLRYGLKNALNYERINKTVVSDKVKNAYSLYEEFIGIKEVRNTQLNVLRAESEFTEASKTRRSIQEKLIQLQEQLKQVRQKLDLTHRGDESYLELITNEHRLIKSELNLLNQMRGQEEIERNFFNTFSQTLRNAHEVERLRQEKSKYLSLMGSILGATLGILATSINHAIKKKDFKQIMFAIESQKLESVNEIKKSQDEIIFSLSSEKFNSLPETAPAIKEEKATQVVGAETMQPQIESLIISSQTNLENQMKINTLATVVATYALFVITFPILVKLFGD